ncbi:MAG TPA: ABC transporter permease [Solirubrobacteraceae bacterium]|jgi:ABC transporter DrrB family efflux protein
MTAPESSAGVLVTAGQVAARTLRKFARTPQLLVVATVQGVLFLIMFRYVFGGAIETGGVAYVDFVVPGFVVAALLFATTAAGVAEDAAEGLFDRLRSLPVPQLSVLAGRVLADTALTAWTVVTTVAVGVLVGFRVHADPVDALAALGLVLVYGFAFTWVFVAVGLVAGSAQAAQGLSLVFIPFSFVSSAYVPVATMPSPFRQFAEHQPLTPMVDAVRALVLDRPPDGAVVTSLVWSAGLAAVFAALSVVLYRRS